MLFFPISQRQGFIQSSACSATQSAPRMCCLLSGCLQACWVHPTQRSEQECSNLHRTEGKWTKQAQLHPQRGKHSSFSSLLALLGCWLPLTSSNHQHQTRFYSNRTGRILEMKSTHTLPCNSDLKFHLRINSNGLPFRQSSPLPLSQQLYWLTLSKALRETGQLKITALR